MNCPRCSAKMVQATNNAVCVDFCEKGCGGIFFDWLELKKMDERYEADPKFLAKIGAGPFKGLSNLENQVKCPACNDTMMMQRFWSIEKSVTLDECAKCGGIWLDAGELLQIYSLYKTEEERRSAAEKYLNKLFGESFKKLQDKESEQLYRKAASVAKFFSPSYYVEKLRKG